MNLEEIAITPENFPPDAYLLNCLKNKIYSIPQLILPTPKLFEIEVKFSFFFSLKMKINVLLGYVLGFT